MTLAPVQIWVDFDQLNTEGTCTTVKKAEKTNTFYVWALVPSFIKLIKVNIYLHRSRSLTVIRDRPRLVVIGVLFPLLEGNRETIRGLLLQPGQGKK